MRSVRLFVSLFVFVIAAAALAQTQQQQPQPPQLTWVRFFNVDMAKGDEWVTYQKRLTGGIFNRLMDEGKIAAWGMATPMVLSGQEWTHVIWATLPKWSGADDINSAFESAMARMTGPEREREMQMMSAVKSMPRDVVLRHLVQGAPSSPTPPRYLRITYYTVKPGRSDDVVKLFRETVESRYTDLTKRGVMGAFGLSTQELVTDPSWTHMLWYFTSDMARFDDVRSSVMGMGTEAWQSLMSRLNEMSEPAKMRQEVLRVIEIGVPKPRS